MSKRAEHYYTESPESLLKVGEAILKLPSGRVYHFKTPSGVFSFGRVDRASRILINHAVLPESGNLLDIGSGYGCVGITLCREHPELSLHMSDINKRAVRFAGINARNHNLHAEIRLGNLYEPWPDRSFDVILSNPPIAAGKLVVESLISGAKDRLSYGGYFELVAYHNKGGSRLESFMKRVFGNALTVVKSGGIRVYVSQKL